MDRRAVQLGWWTLNYFAALQLLLLGCTGDTGPVGGSCTVDKNAATDTAKITCSDGTTAVLPGGTNGSACSVHDNGDGTKTITCNDGTTVTVTDGKGGTNGKSGSNGVDGTTGSMGKTGAPGAPGNNGSDGTTGAPGSPGHGAIVVGAGVQVKILNVTFPADLHPVVSLRILDAADQPLDRLGVYSQGAVNVGFMLAYLSSSSGVVGQYVPYDVSTVSGVSVGGVAPVLASAAQPAADSGGTWTEVDSTHGLYSYRFAAGLPPSYDASKTHTLAAFASRTYAGVQYASNPVFHFRPDSNAITEKREIVTTAACNGCHDTLAVHGGVQRELGSCITCHVDGMADPESGNTLDMRQMIHKIHRGAKLPSVRAGTPYHLVGYNNQDHDYSNVVFPQPLENCTACHQGGADSAHWKTEFSRVNCGSCHDDVAFAKPVPAGKKLHSGGVQTTDGLCNICHSEGTSTFASLLTDVVRVHQVPQKFDLRDATTGNFLAAPPVITAHIVGVTNVGAAQFPVLTFDVSVDGAPYDILASGKALDSLRFTFAGPTSDYLSSMQYAAQGSGATGSLAAAGNPGQFKWTSASTLAQISAAPTALATPAPAIPLTGSWAVGIEGQLKRKASKPDNTQIDVSYPFHNDVAYFAVTDPTAVPRRAAVATANCNRCHSDLGAHGGSSNDAAYCVLCHGANADTTNIPAPTTGTTKLTASLRLSHMVHRIHTGESGTSELQVGSNDFAKVVFPGDRRDCQQCHVAGGFDLPVPSLLPSHMTRVDSNLARVSGSDTYQGPTSAACTGCHDATSTQVHTLAMSVISPTDPTNIQESCATCHASGEAFGMDTVHARLGL